MKLTRTQELVISHAVVFIIGAMFGLYGPWTFVERQAMVQAETPRLMLAADAAVAPTLDADALSEWIAPKARDFCEKNKETWIQNSGGTFHRLALKTVWPWGMKMVPKGTRALVGYANDKLSTLTLGELATYLENHVRDRGDDPAQSPLIKELRRVKGATDHDH